MKVLKTGVHLSFQSHCQEAYAGHCDLHKDFCFTQRQGTTGKFQDKNDVIIIEMIIHVIPGRVGFSLGIKLKEEGLCIPLCFPSLVCLEPFRKYFFFLSLNHRAGLCYPKTMFKLDYKTASRYDGSNNILSPFNIKADDNYHPILTYTVSFSAKCVPFAWCFRKQCIEFDA